VADRGRDRAPCGHRRTATPRKWRSNEPRPSCLALTAAPRLPLLHSLFPSPCLLSPAALQNQPLRSSSSCASVAPACGPRAAAARFASPHLPHAPPPEVKAEAASSSPCHGRSSGELPVHVISSLCLLSFVSRARHVHLDHAVLVRTLPSPIVARSGDLAAMQRRCLSVCLIAVACDRLCSSFLHHRVRLTSGKHGVVPPSPESPPSTSKRLSMACYAPGRLTCGVGLALWTCLSVSLCEAREKPRGAPSTSAPEF
jgi:hypothetical protein